MAVKRILCYGDSNTWGATPGTGVRIDEDKRWTGVCRKILGDGYRILEEGLSGRTTVYDDPCNPVMNGLSALGYTLCSQKPIELVVLFLGTNDLKFTNAIGSANGIDTLLYQILNANVIYPGSCPVFPGVPKVLLIAPPLILPEIDEAMPDSRFTGRAHYSREFSRLYRQVAEKYGVAFLDAAQFVRPSEVDCLHLDESGHAVLGAAIARAIEEIFA